MFNKIVVLIFSGVLFATSAVALAGNNKTLNDSNKIVSVVNGITGASVEMQAEYFRSEYTTLNASSGESTTLPVSGWLLAMALFGFVLLSNRTGI